MQLKYTKEILAPIIENSQQWAEVCRKIGIKPFTGAQHHLKKVAIKLKIDYSHFKGQGWSKGKQFGPRRTLMEYLVCDGPFIKSHSLKQRLIAEGIKAYMCEHCKQTEWQGVPIPLELDHIDGYHFNNELSNLQILCSNCHSIKHRRDGETENTVGLDPTA